jgi:hypothetical protein
MILHIHSDASYLSVSNARIRLGGLFFLGNTPPDQDKINGSILNVAAVIKQVVAVNTSGKAGAQIPHLPWEMMHLAVGDNALCAPPYTVYTAV